MGVNLDACAYCGHSERIDHRIVTRIVKEQGFVPYATLRRACDFEYGDDIGRCDCSQPVSHQETRERLRKADRRDAIVLLPITIALIVIALLVAFTR